MDPPLGGSRFISMTATLNSPGAVVGLPLGQDSHAGNGGGGGGGSCGGGGRRDSRSPATEVSCGDAVRKFATAIGVNSDRRKPVPPFGVTAFEPTDSTPLRLTLAISLPLSLDPGNPATSCMSERRGKYKINASIGEQKHLSRWMYVLRFDFVVVAWSPTQSSNVSKVPASWYKAFL